MAKVAKNIRQFRKDKGITQEALAEKLNVTRQAVSNWENDKTQPDIDSLEKLSEIFEVRIEELIYGKNKFTQDENDKTRQKNIMKILLSVFGSLFTGVGLVLLFVFFWVDFPLPVKTAFCIIPVIFGQAFAVFVYLKKKSSTVWSESAAVIWCVGVIATIALINSVYDIHYGYENYLIIDALLCLPSIFVFNAVAPIAPYFYMVLHWSVFSENFIVGLILLVLGGLYLLYNKSRLNEQKVKFAFWLSVIASVLFIFFAMMMFDTSPLTVMIAVFAFLFAVSKENPDRTMPFYIPGLLGTAFFAILLSNLDFIKDAVYYGGETNISKIIMLALCLLIIGAGVFIGRESYEENIIKILITSFTSLLIVMLFVWNFFVKTGQGFFSVIEYTDSAFNNIFEIILFLPAVATGVCLIIGGVNKIRLIEVNLGIIMLFAELVQITIMFSDINILVLSLVFIVFGAVLITVNCLMSKKKKDLIYADATDKEAENE